MKLFLNQIDLPLGVGEQVFVNQPLFYWADNDKKVVPYFSGQIKSIEIIFDPKTRFIHQKSQQQTIIVDMIRYEVLPHSHFNPFGLVQILDQVAIGSKLFPSEQALLQATGNELSVYHIRKGELSTTSTL